MRCAAFTVDVDRDVNEPREGAVEAACRGSPVPRYSSTREGLEIIVDMLDELGVKGTFFMEGEAAEVLSTDIDLRNLLNGHEVAAHGYAHEDLTGESTGIIPSEEWLDAIIGRSLAVIEDVTGVRPQGFRAPYQHINEQVVAVLQRRGLMYDSTLFAEMPSGLHPYLLPSGLIEVPLAQGRDATGRRMQSYLWPLHEGRREVNDYLQLIDGHEDGLFVLADHSWHIVESLSGVRSPQRAETEIGKVRHILQGTLDRGVEIVTLSNYIRMEGML
ncbi:MAG: polysaccharide deacetylase family protein [Methanomassiliicoccus sp.]|nr:polysaccharide deacetylase family protein [Methanomassiliicoccus sp.]